MKLNRREGPLDIWESFEAQMGPFEFNGDASSFPPFSSFHNMSRNGIVARVRWVFRVDFEARLGPNRPNDGASSFPPPLFSL